MRSELPKQDTDSRRLVENQRSRLEGIRKENEEFDRRAEYLHGRIKEYQDKLFQNQMGEKIKELVKENLKLSVDAQCLSIQLDIYNQGAENQGIIDNRNSPGTSAQHPGHSPHQMMNPYHMGGSPVNHRGNSPVSPMHSGVIRGNTPTSNVVTLDTSSGYQYARVVQQPNPMSPYPVQPQVGYPMNNGQPSHLSPHHEPSRQISHPGTPLYTYDRQIPGSLNILSHVPPAALGASWGPQMANYPMSPMPISSSPGQQMPHGPPLPPRPTDLPIRGRVDGRSGLPTPPHRPVPPPPTPPKLPSRSPNLDRPRSSNEMPGSHSEPSRPWQCAKCTFENHEDINECEMCQNPRHGSVGVHSGAYNRSPH